jgi:hypothetical protein
MGLISGGADRVPTETPEPVVGSGRVRSLWSRRT